MFGRPFWVVRVAALAACSVSVAVHIRKNDLLEPCNEELAGLRCCRTQHDHGQDSAVSSPMVVWTHGCARSSAVMFMLKEMAERSGRPALDCGRGFELLADISKGFYAIKDDPNRAFHSFVKRAAASKRRLLFKGETKYAMKDQNLMRDLSILNANIVPLKRENALDVALCSVHDCFGGWLPNKFGYSIDGSGNRSDNCAFRSRNTSASGEQRKEKIVVDTEHLLQNLHKITADQGASELFLKKHGFAFNQPETSEDLFAFRSGNNGFETSLASWTRLVQKLGISLNTSEVAGYLRKYSGDVNAEQRHSELIENYEDVKNVMSTCVLKGKDRRSGDEFRGPLWCARAMSMLRD